MVTFNSPQNLALLILVPGFLVIGFLINRLQAGAIRRIGKRQTLSRFSSFTDKRTAVTVFSVSLALLAVASAEPALESNVNASAPTLNAIIVMDVSRSMLAEDGPQGQSRLELGITAVEKLLEEYPDGHIGLVLYTNEVFMYPPTFDHHAVRILLRDILENYSVRGEGSKPVEALYGAVKIIEDLSATADVIFFISDGGKSLIPNTAEPSLIHLQEKLRELNIRILVAGIGGFVPAPIPVRSENGGLIGYHLFGGTVAYTSLEESFLRRLAEISLGWYLRLSGPDDLVRLAKEHNLDSQPMAKPSTVSLIWPPVALALLLMAGWLIGSSIRPRLS